MPKVIYKKGSEENGYSISTEFEKEVMSRNDRVGSASHIRQMLMQQKNAERKKLYKDYPEEHFIARSL